MMPFSPKKSRFSPYSRQGFISFEGAQLIFVVILLFIFIAVFPRLFSKEVKFIPLNQKMDYFSGIDVHGNEHWFHDIKGKLNLVVFGASWCIACAQSMNDIESIYQKYSNKDFKVIYIAIEKSIEGMGKFEKRFSPSYLMLLQNEDILKHFNTPSAIPSYFILDSSGVLLYKSVGYFPKTEIKSLMKKMEK